MKYFSVLLLAASFFSAGAQTDFPVKDGRIVYLVADSALAKTKDSLFTQALKWTEAQFGRSRDVVQLQDIESGIISGNGKIPYVVRNLGSENLMHARLSFRIRVRDHAASLQLDQIRSGRIGEPPAENLAGKSGIAARHAAAMQAELNRLTGSFLEAMAK